MHASKEDTKKNEKPVDEKRHYGDGRGQSYSGHGEPRGMKQPYGARQDDDAKREPPSESSKHARPESSQRE